MNIAICVSGVNDKDSKITEQLRRWFPGQPIYYHTFTNRTNLVPQEFHDRLYTMHYPKWHYHPMEVTPPSKHEKYGEYVKSKKMFDEFYFGIVPIIQHFDLLKKIPLHHDLIIRVDWNTRLDRQVNLNHHLRYAYENGPVGFMTRKGRGSQFGSGHWSDVDKENKSDDWYGYLPFDFLIHHRKHACHKTFKTLLKEHKLYPNQWGWYQVMSEPFGDIHTSVHGLAELIK